ncbi:related to Septation protein SUN4 [Saccharomycodes ludwigii]|uniref:Related to Septation protein SUN4 n=1 Tax=Saccharomycodes ludwigii TaxID=36035 RepID=A0A376BA55_9ASCO|nr:related to Septation protein SUN4 [Saccharomycodes ludwigii]
MRISKSFALVLSTPFLAVADAGNHHHHDRRALEVDYVYHTVTVDQNGSTVLPTTTLTPIDSDSGFQTASTTSIDSLTSNTVSVIAESISVSEANTSATEIATTTTSSPATTTSSPATTTSSSATATSSSATATSSSSSNGPKGDLGWYDIPTEKFVDGTIACSDFPSGQGVISLDWLGFGGWSGIENDDGSTGGDCKEGSYCSYSCQPGMSKTQWPSNQPSNGVSVGGLLCKDGYLYRSNPDTDYLCEWGVDVAYVVSELDEVVSICRTDYPGTENMVIPTIVEAGATLPLTTVNEETYYQWEGKMTSAQYYVNNAGVSMEEGCVWGTAGSGVGNWAPLNFGAGSSAGVTYLSLIPNPNNKEAANFNVKIVAADSDSTISGSCVYENGKYNGDGTSGCTIGVTSGKAHFVLYN